MDTKNKKPRYTGELAKPIPYRLALAAALEGDKEWLPGVESDRLLLLLQHYGIDSKSRNPWFALALRLAREHVPGFRYSYKRVGRPVRATNYIAYLSKKSGKVSPKKRGAPRKWDEKSYAELLRDVELRKQQLESKGGRITNKQAITDLLAEEARRHGKSATRVPATDVAYYQKRLSEARRGIPKNPKN